MIRASPGLQSGEAGFETRENALSCKIPGFSPGENAPSSPINPIRIPSSSSSDPAPRARRTTPHSRNELSLVFVSGHDFRGCGKIEFFEGDGLQAVRK